MVLTCTACHGDAVMGVVAAGFPRLAGQSADYLAKQLYHFKAGKRSNTFTQQFAAELSDQDVQSVRGGFAALPAARYASPSRTATAAASVRAWPCVVPGNAIFPSACPVMARGATLAKPSRHRAGSLLRTWPISCTTGRKACAAMIRTTRWGISPRS